MTTNEAERERLLRHLAEQMKHHHIDPMELEQTLATLEPEGARPLPGWFVLAAPLLVVAVVGGFLYQFWESMQPSLRMALSLGAGAVLHLPAFMFLARPDRARMGQLLLLLASGLELLGWGVLARLAWPPLSLSGAALLALLLMAVQSLLVWRHDRRAFLLFYPLLYIYALLLLGLTALGGHPVATLLAVGVSMFSLGQLLPRTPLFAQAGLWQGFAAALLYFALFKLSQRYELMPLFLLLSLGGLWLSLSRRQPVLYAGSAAALAAGMLAVFSPLLLESSLWAFTLVLEGIGVFCLMWLLRARWRA